MSKAKALIAEAKRIYDGPSPLSDPYTKVKKLAHDLAVELEKAEEQMRKTGGAHAVTIREKMRLQQDRDRLDGELKEANERTWAATQSLDETEQALDKIEQDRDRHRGQLGIEMAAKYKAEQEVERLRVQFRCTRLPGGPDNEAEFIELETWDGKGLGPANGWYWLKDGDSYLLTSKPQPKVERCPDPECVTNGGHKACWGR